MLGLKSRKYKKINFLYLIMKSLNNFAEETLRYEAPAVEVVEISVERGFELSARGFEIDGTYEEADLW